MTKFLPIEEAVAKIHSGSLLAMSGNNHKSSMAITRELVRQNVGDLKLVFTPAGGINGDMLIGAGLVTAVETGSLTFGESGLAPNYRRVAKEGGIAAMDTTWPVTLTGLQAGANGVPFIPSRGVIGADFLDLHPDWKIIEDPYSPGEDIVLVPATKPDFALIHAYKADKTGNVLAPGYDDRMVAQASDKVIVTVEEIVDYDLAEDPRGGYVIPWPFVNTVVLSPNAAHPGAMEPVYDVDQNHLGEYIAAAKSPEAYKEYLNKYVIGHTEAEYQEMVLAVSR